MKKHQIPRISVVIPTFNSGPFLREALESVFSQSQPPDEVIVVNDGSTDGSCSSLPSFPGPVTIIHQNNQGTAHALARGVSAAAGKFLAFLDSDDLWTSDKLKLQSAVLDSHPTLDFCLGDMRLFHSNELSKTEKECLPLPAQSVPGYVQSSMLIRKSSFIQAGNFDPDVQAGEFLDWFLRARAAGLKYEYLNQTVLMRRVHRQNKSRTIDNLRDYIPILRKELRRGARSRECCATDSDTAGF